MFSFLTHWTCEAKWVLVFKLVHLLDGNAEEGSCHLQLAVLKGKTCWPFPSQSLDPLQWVQSLYDFELALTSTLTVHLREFSQSTYWYKITVIQLPCLLPSTRNGTKSGWYTPERQRQRHFSERWNQIIGEENRLKMMHCCHISPIQRW